jgi:hypothetical protein
LTGAVNVDSVLKVACLENYERVVAQGYFVSIAMKSVLVFVQESRAQVGGRNGRVDDGACLLRKGVPSLLGDIGA